MDILNDKKNEYLSKLEALKQINDLGSKDFNLNNFLNGESDIFSEMVELSESILLNSETGSSNSLSTLKKITIDSVEKVNVLLKDIILDNVKKSFFVGDGLCGTETEVNTSQITIKPSEIDYLDILKINPQTNSGKIIYENDEDRKQKVNKELYKTFSGSSYLFKTNSNASLFSCEWDGTQQLYKINLNDNNVGNFFEKYYSSISLPTKRDILKNNLLISLQGENSIGFTKKVINLNSILDKIFKNCNTKNDVQDNESFSGIQDTFIDDSGLFNFDDIECFVTENLNYDSVMKFSTCYEIEVPVKDDIIDEIIYYDETDEPIDNVVDDAIDKVAQHTEIMSNYELNVPNIKIGFIKDFILNLPKTFMHSIFTPKIILPIVIMYKKVKGIVGDIKISDLFSELKKLFVKIIKDLFWGFINEVWKVLKGYLVKTLKKIGVQFVKNKSNRYLSIVTGLLSLVKSLPLNSLDDCGSVYEAILKSIDSVVNVRNNINVPSPLLLVSDQLNGFSQDRAVLNIVESLNKKGISTSPIYGEENNLLKIIDSVIEGNTNEIDQNGYIKIVLKEGTIPSGPGGAIIPPGLISGVGKMF